MIGLPRQAPISIALKPMKPAPLRDFRRIDLAGHRIA